MLKPDTTSIGAALAGLLLVAATSYADIWHVDKDNTSGVEDGLTWATAFTTIQPAIDTAATDPDNEIWIAEGVYDEPRTHLVEGVNWGSLVLRDGVRLYGGFASHETQRDQRNTLRHRSVIDGLRARDGGRAFHTIVAANNTSLNGLTISGGGAVLGSISGSGVFVENLSDVIIEGCVLSENVGSSGGGIRVFFGDGIFIRRCAFVRNRTEYYGSPALLVMINDGNTAEVSDSVFIENEIGSLATEELGDACAVLGGTKLTRCTFIRNTGTSLLMNLTEASPALTDCDFINNAGVYTAFVFPRDDLGVSVVQRCVFSGNVRSASVLSMPGAETSIADGVDFASLTRIENSAFVNNASQESTPYYPVVVVSDGNFDVQHSVFAGN